MTGVEVGLGTDPGVEAGLGTETGLGTDPGVEAGLGTDPGVQAGLGTETGLGTEPGAQPGHRTEAGQRSPFRHLDLERRQSPESGGDTGTVPDSAAGKKEALGDPLEGWIFGLGEEGWPGGYLHVGCEK